MDTIVTTFGLNPNGTVDRQDNGQGFFGYNTRDPQLMGASLPPNVVSGMYGSTLNALKAVQQGGPIMVQVTNPATGGQMTVPVVDIGPGAGPQSKGVGLDATYGLTKSLGFTGRNPAQYNIVSAPGLTPDQIGQLGPQTSQPSEQVPINSPTSPLGQDTTGYGAGIPNINDFVQAVQVVPGTNFDNTPRVASPSGRAARGLDVSRSIGSPDTNTIDTSNPGNAIKSALPMVSDFLHGLTGIPDSSKQGTGSQQGQSQQSGGQSNFGKLGGFLNNLIKGGASQVSEGMHRVWSGFGANTPGISPVANYSPQTMEQSNKVNLGSSSSNGGGDMSAYMIGNRSFSSNSTGPVGDQADLSQGLNS